MYHQRFPRPVLDSSSGCPDKLYMHHGSCARWRPPLSCLLGWFVPSPVGTGDRKVADEFVSE